MASLYYIQRIGTAIKWYLWFFFSTMRKLFDLMRKGYGSVTKWKCWLCLGDETVGISLLLNTLLYFLMILYWDASLFIMRQENRKKRGGLRSRRSAGFRGSELSPSVDWFITSVRSLLSGSCFQNIRAGRMDFKGPSIFNTQDQYLDGCHPSCFKSPSGFTALQLTCFALHISF